MSDNLRYWNKGRSVPAEAQKGFTNGSFSGTDINPVWRLQMLTEMFGPCGIGWYYTIDEHWTEAIGQEVHTHVIISLYVKVDGEWSKPIVGEGGNKSLQIFSKGPKASDEGYKMALTDAISVSCKALGLGADVYFAHAKTKYTEDWSEPQTAPAQNGNEVVEETKPLSKAERMEMAMAIMDAATSRDELATKLKPYADLKSEPAYVKRATELYNTLK